ncbi:MAG: thiamine pyrophosphate-dependent dehydrogenase E1 component subunit alpha [Thermoplasmata archaeon]
MAKAAPPPSETPTSPSPPGLPIDQLRALYRGMVRSRVLDERCLSLQRQGRIGFYAPASGQEAAQFGCAVALAPDDWIFAAYREIGLPLWRGVPLPLLLDQFWGNSGDLNKGRQMPNHYGFRDHRIVVGSSPIGTQITHAVGAAMAIQRRKDPIVTATFFGDGATSSNDFHAGMNFAGVYRTPTIFFCQNNQWAISLPRERQTRSPTLAQKAEAYGFNGVVVDGTDVEAVYRAVYAARERALSGGGPTLIEAQVYRFGPHSTSDDPRRYRTDQELEAWRKRDPILRLRDRLTSSGHWSEDEEAKLLESVRAELAEAIAKAEATPPVAPETLFDDTFAQRTPQLEAEREEYLRAIQEGIIRP